MENTHEPIIDLDTWEQVQARISSNKAAPSNNEVMVNSTNSVSLFTGLIRSADCGSAIKDEKSLISRILSVTESEAKRERAAQRQSVTKLQKRLNHIDQMIKQLFEEKAIGSIPLSTFQRLLSDYNQERE